MKEYTYNVGDIVKMKMKHPCGSFEWRYYAWGQIFD